MPKIQISIEKIKEWEQFRITVNTTDLNDIEFTENGIPIQIPNEVIEEYKFIGLTNCNFIEMNFHTKEVQDELLKLHRDVRNGK